MSFHEIRFPTAISRGAQGGPERRTDVVVLGSGYEERNSRWANSRRSYNAGYGVRSLDALHEVIAFLRSVAAAHGFRWRDHADWKSGPPSAVTTPLDQVIGTGSRAGLTFQLKRLTAFHTPPSCARSQACGGHGENRGGGRDTNRGHAFRCRCRHGTCHVRGRRSATDGAIVTAGFEFDVPVRFDTDKLEINLSGFQSGAIPSIPVVEIRL